MPETPFIDSARQAAGSTEQVQTLDVQQEKPAKTVQDWVRDLRMSADVNKTTLGVETDRVTPDLMLAASRKLLAINRRETEGDPKDSLQFQRVYGPTDFFAEHIMRDAGKVGRNLLWKATNKGNMDFVPTAALDQHVTDVFNTSKMGNMVDGSSPLELVEASYKVTRIGEGGVGDVDSAPTEMRLVQPSFLGFVDPVRSVESLRVGLDAYLTKHCMKGSDGKLYQKFVNARTGKEELVDSVTAAKSVITTPDMMEAKTKNIYALGGKTGVRIVKKSDVDYYLPRMDDAFTKASNMVTALSGVKELRLLMGCLHPLTNVITVNSRNEVFMTSAKDIGDGGTVIPGMDAEGCAVHYPIRTTVAKFPPGRSWFRKVVLYSGRTLTTSRDHRWPVLRNGGTVLVNAEQLKPGDKVLRTTFKDIRNRRTFINGVQVNTDIALLIGCAVRSLHCPKGTLLTVNYSERHSAGVRRALDRLGLTDSVKLYTMNRRKVIATESGWFHGWLKSEVGVPSADRRVPPCILSAHLDVAGAFLDAYTADESLVGMDALECMWVLDLPNTAVRDALAFLFARTGTDTHYRDSFKGNGEYSLALKLVDSAPERFGDCIVDEVKSVMPVQNAPVMIDVDINDNMYAVACGVVTHNSKYPQQAVSVQGREAPLVRNIDGQSGKDFQSTIGRFLGARYMDKPGTVSAVRKDCIDVAYDDGTKGRVTLYENFPMNAKGFITNTPQVKAGMHLDKGGLLASSNYTDSKGVSALGTNLRTGWLSWKGGTYEDAIVLSESAAKKLTSDTMYATNLDLDKTVSLGTKNYLAWKPGEFTKEQLSSLDSNGVIKPGTVLRKGDPMVLAVRTTEPSPGTMGKRVLTDISEVWDHDHPGIVTDVVQTRKGVKVMAVVSAPVEVGDKVSNGYGAKGVVSKIFPDDQMPKDKDGQPLEMIMSPLGLITRTNPAQLTETLLGKVARKTGVTETVPAFYKGDIHQYVMDKLKQNKLSAEDDFFDPETGRKIPGILNGYSYIYKLKHLAESKMSARGTGEYTADDTPGGSGFDGSKRFGTLEQTAMVGHGAMQNILDQKLIRGQSNSDFWRSIRTGGIPVIPGEPLVQKKFFAHLQGSGVNVRKTPKGISVFALSSGDVKDMAGSRELKSRDTYEAKTFRPMDGGLFGQDIFGLNGDKWGYIQLDEPLPNPVMAEPLAKLLRMSDRDFTALAAGEKTVDGMSNGAQLKERLAKVDLAAESAQALKELKEARASQKDKALKRYVAVENMRRAGVQPADYMLDRIPVLPPVYRPISSHSGLTMVADANYLYAQLLDARDDLRDAKDLPKEYQDKARSSIYRKWQELTGMYDPEDVKLRNKNVGGLLQWALGKGSPKFSAVQRKVIGSSVDTVGRGAVVPNAKLTVDQLGIPVKMAFGIMAPFVERSLVKRGYTPLDAMKMVKKQSPQAFDVLKEVVKTHPVELNRAPTLHKYNIMAFEPVLVQGNAVQVHPSICPGFAMDFDGNCCDFDSVISLKLSRSALEKTGFMACVDPGNGPGQCGDTFSPGEGDPDTVYCSTKIGEFPRKGVPMRDRNGALVYPVPEGVSVLSCDPVTGVPEYRPVTAVTVEENCHTVELSFGSRKVIVSDNESLAAFDSKAGALIKVSPASIGDRLVPVLKRQPLHYGSLGDRDLGWLLGAFISDGWVTRDVVGYSKLEDSKRTEFVRILRAHHGNFTCREYTDQPKTGKNKLGASAELHLHGKSLAGWMRSWHLVDEAGHTTGRAAPRKRIGSKLIQQGSEDFLWGLFSGLLDGDGSVSRNTVLKKPRFTARFSTSSKQLADDVCALCYRLGLRYSMTVVPPRGFSGTAYIVIPSSIDLHANLGRITCIGERELRLIGEWKRQASPKDTRDVIPLSVKEADALLKLATARKDTGVASGIRKAQRRSCICGGRAGLMRYCDDIREAFPELYSRIKNVDTVWHPVTALEDAGNRQVFDLMVEGTKVFAINNGVVIWDTANVHVPVSDGARKEAMDRMRPSRNLIALSNHKIMYKPEKEYAQGLYIASRTGKSPDGRARIFRTLTEARDAQRRGEIDVDTPVQILDTSK